MSQHSKNLYNSMNYHFTNDQTMHYVYKTVNKLKIQSVFQVHDRTMDFNLTVQTIH